MLKYIIRRILQMIPVLLGISFIIFSIMAFTPGDPAKLILGENATEEAVMQLKEEMGLNDKFIVRYVRYITNALKGDFGVSYRNKLPVFEELFSRFPTTLTLTFWAISISVIIGIPIGIISAVKQYTIIDNLSLIVTLILTSVPGFWLGLMLIMLFSLKLGWLPATGIDTWKHFVLPSVTLAGSCMATVIRMTRSSMLEVIRQDYIRTARAKGAGEKRVILKHAFKNALLPIITVVGLTFGLQLGGAIITESVFAIPGLGTLMVTSVRMKDIPMVMASVLFVAFAVGIINLIVDILYAFIDPRVKAQYERK